MERGGQIASRMQGIYVFCRGELLTARAERNPGRVEGVGEPLGELRAAWAQIAGDEPPDLGMGLGARERRAATPATGGASGRAGRAW